jgi:deazaflavin-dependent oxidoreductase (nitroreductase family)
MTTYRKPPWPVVHILNPGMRFLIRRGFSLGGKSILEVRGRRSGDWQRTPVNVLRQDGNRYLVSPRGETQWARNLRAAQRCRLRLGAQVEEVKATEVPDDERAPMLRAYLRQWTKETRAHFEISGPDAPEDEFRKIAPNHPVFRVEGG